ncbi:MAG: metallophosphoesterase family protein [Beijerinckiaceae bacterium]
MLRTAFRLAVISDVHLSPLPRIAPQALIGKRATGYLNWHLKRKKEHDMRILDAVIADMQAEKPDHILFAGDAVNLGLRREFETARAFLERLGPPSGVSAIPGNHDLYVRSSRAPMLACFGPWMTGDDTPAGIFPYVRRMGSIAFIGLNSALPTPPLDASGTLGAQQIAATRDILAALPEDCVRIVALHHPANVGGTAKGRELRDAAAFESMLTSVHADLIVHGHNHYQSLGYCAGSRGPIPVFGAMSGSGANHKFGGAPGWAMVTISARPNGGSGLVHIDAHEWRDGTIKVRQVL